MDKIRRHPRAMAWFALLLAAIGPMVLDASGLFSSVLAQKGKPSPSKPSKTKAGQNSGNNGTFTTSTTTDITSGQGSAGGGDASFSPAGLDSQQADERVRVWGGVLP